MIDTSLIDAITRIERERDECRRLYYDKIVECARLKDAMRQIAESAHCYEITSIAAKVLAEVEKP